MNSQDFIKFNRKSIIRVPKSIVRADIVKNLLSYSFILYSFITIILYFSNIQYPQIIDIILSLCALSIPILHFIYVTYKEKTIKIDKIKPVDDIQFSGMIFDRN